MVHLWLILLRSVVIWNSNSYLNKNINFFSKENITEILFKILLQSSSTLSMLSERTCIKFYMSILLMEGWKEKLLLKRATGSAIACE